MIAQYSVSGRYYTNYNIPFDINEYKEFLDGDEHCEDYLYQFLNEKSENMIGDDTYESEDSDIYNYKELMSYIKENLK